MKKLLVVEDDEAIRDALSLVFTNGDIALSLHEEGSQILSEQVMAPDVFLIDKNLPGVSGTDIWLFIKQSSAYRHVPVVMFSASPSIVLLAAEIGADAVITKPFSLSVLRDTIAKLIG
ncbi:response regulator transcription factor [Sediminibacterium soli]|uniref:response regulator transcription factor n=1 Tax=Sediminibacterium soli TaxID=2698829 RepID=UPI00137B3779|nr:response regulator [Sediminibacterium soli]NCI46748.1 response regulator [Sediminibacterium soli]